VGFCGRRYFRPTLCYGLTAPGRRAILGAQEDTHWGWRGSYVALAPRQKRSSQMREHAPKRHHAQKEWTVGRGRILELTRESDTDRHPNRSWPGAGTETGPGHDFSLIPVHTKPAPGMPPNGPLDTRAGTDEDEADSVAEQLDRVDGGGPAVTLAPTPVGGVSEPVGSRVQPSPHGAGEALPGQTRAYFEDRFGHDFGDVRVHRDAEVARAAGARAFTLGHDIVFGAGQYQPATRAGRRLLAHELTHVVQQRSARSASPQLQPETTKQKPVTKARETSRPATEKDKTSPVVKTEVSADVGFKILKDAFGTLKKDLVQGEVKVVDQAGIQAAYDNVYGKSEYAWDTYIKPKFGNLRGWAYQGVNYINKDSLGLDVGTVVHEMLHNNIASDWRGVVGHQFDEGATEYLTVFAMKKAGVPRTSAYDKQLDIINAVVGVGLPDADVKTAYLVAGAQKLIADWFTGAMESTWTDFKADMEKEDYAKAKAKIKKKAGAVEKK
jgi:hypothetical protein